MMRQQQQQPPPHKKQPAQQRTPLGKPIVWSDDDLDALAAISPADLKAAEALWQRDAPTPLKPLLQAQVLEHEKEQKAE